jgi:hypothetical protein
VRQRGIGGMTHAEGRIGVELPQSIGDGLCDLVQSGFLKEAANILPQRFAKFVKKVRLAERDERRFPAETVALKISESDQPVRKFRRVFP